MLGQVLQRTIGKTQVMVELMQGLEDKIYNLNRNGMLQYREID